MDRLNLRPVDVGFDLRITQHPVLLPEIETDIEVECLNKDDQPILLVGTLDQLKQQLQTLGYVIFNK